MFLNHSVLQIMNDSFFDDDKFVSPEHFIFRSYEHGHMTDHVIVIGRDYLSEPLEVH